MPELTSKERITRALLGQDVDRIPFCPFLAYVWESFPAEVQQNGLLAFHHDIGADPLWRGAPCPVAVETPYVEVRSRSEGNRSIVETITPVGALRTAYRVTSGAGKQTAFQVEHPLKTEADYRTQIWIEEHTEIRPNPGPADDFLDADGREGLALGMLCFRGKTAFQSVIEHYAGTQEFYQAFYVDSPDTVRALLEAMVHSNRICADIAADGPYDHYLTFEDSSTQNYSPELYAAYIAPEIADWCEMLARRGKRYVQHACGHARHLLPMMVDGGVLAVESLSPPPTGNIPLAEARALIGDRMGVIGGIEPTRFLASSLEELRAYAREVLRDGAGGPFVLANSDSCPPGVSVDKFRLVAAVARGEE